MDKPSVFYHASPTLTPIAILEPRAHTIRDTDDGKVVFATPYLAYASCFLNRNDSTWVQHGRFGKGNPFYCVISDEVKFRSTDNGGIIYTLPNTTFYYDNKYGTGDIEWLSRKVVTPITYTEYKSALETMLQNEVQVFFVTERKFDEIMKAQDFGLEALRGMKSENQKYCINVKPLLTM